MFLDIGMSLILLKRHDGSIAKLDLTTLDTKQNFVRWIASKSTLPVEQLKTSSYTITEPAVMPVFMIFVDFKDPVVAAKSD